MRPSQSFDFVEEEATRVAIGARFFAWWLETTDVVILNSPWLQRGTGRALRCFWILLQLLRWCALLYTSIEARSKLLRDSWMLFGVLGMLLCLGHVLYASIRVSRDRFLTGLVFCVGLVTCVACYSGLEFTTEDKRTRVVYMDDIVFTFMALCHCSVHPLVLLLLLPLFLDQIEIPEAPQDGMAIQSSLSFCCIMCALTKDFSTRVKAVSTGMLYGDGDANDPLDSPLAGRSGRPFCWLAVIGNWICWLLYMVTMESEAVWKVAEAFLFLLALSLVLLSNALGPLYADAIMALLCHAPGLLLAIRVMNSQFISSAGEDIHTSYMRYLAQCFAWLYFSEATQVLGTQTLIQAGCHPLVCAAGFLLLLAQVLLETIWWDGRMEQDTSAWSLLMPLGRAAHMPYFIIHMAAWITRKVSFSCYSCLRSLRTPVPVCLLLVGSHLVDYQVRLKAIREGLRLSAGNAASSEVVAGHLEMSVLETAETELSWEPGEAEQEVWQWVEGKMA